MTTNPRGGYDEAERSRQLDALADVRRRRALEVLREAESLSLTALASELAERADVDDPTRRLEIELHHRHLPKLSDAGLVDYDAEARTVSLVEAAPQPAPRDLLAA